METLKFELEENLYQELETLANKQDTTITNVITKLLEMHLLDNTEPTKTWDGYWDEVNGYSDEDYDYDIL